MSKGRTSTPTRSDDNSAPPSLRNPLSVLDFTLSKVPGLKILFGVVAVVAILAIVQVFRIDWRYAIFGGIAVIVFGFVLLALAAAGSANNPHVKVAATILLYFCILLFMVWATLLTTCTFGQWPLPVTKLLDPAELIKSYDIGARLRAIRLDTTERRWSSVEKTVENWRREAEFLSGLPRELVAEIRLYEVLALVFEARLSEAKTKLDSVSEYREASEKVSSLFVYVQATLNRVEGQWESATNALLEIYRGQQYEALELEFRFSVLFDLYSLLVERGVHGDLPTDFWERVDGATAASATNRARRQLLEAWQLIYRGDSRKAREVLLSLAGQTSGWVEDLRRYYLASCESDLDSTSAPDWNYALGGLDNRGDYVTRIWLSLSRIEFEATHTGTHAACGRIRMQLKDLQDYAADHNVDTKDSSRFADSWSCRTRVVSLTDPLLFLKSQIDFAGLRAELKQQTQCDASATPEIFDSLRKCAFDLRDRIDGKGFVRIETRLQLLVAESLWERCKRDSICRNELSAGLPEAVRIAFQDAIDWAEQKGMLYDALQGLEARAIAWRFTGKMIEYGNDLRSAIRLCVQLGIKDQAESWRNVMKNELGVDQ